METVAVTDKTMGTVPVSDKPKDVFQLKYPMNDPTLLACST